MTEPIITTKNLCHTYQNDSLQKAALMDVTLEIKRGSCIAIIGVTGSGKSTLVQHFNGLLSPTSGTVTVGGIPITKHSNLHQLRQHVAMLFQFPESQLFAHTVYADVAFGPQRMKLAKREIRQRVLASLEAVGLPAYDFAQRSPFGLSGGQMRRVALAGVLAMSPTVLVLDEPTTGLDAAGREEFYYYLRRIQNDLGVTIVLVTHDMTEVASLAEQIFVLHHGCLVLRGTPRSIFTHSDTLRQWNLAEPPLCELLQRLRQQGLAIPDDVLTLDEAFTVLQELNTIHQENYHAQ